MTHPPPTNRLIHEKSPYLQQHAHNPVDWFPWGPEAFEKAKREDKPIFLSIGYATCHWCHVMEKESFSHEETAKLLNETFVNIKVDREELPAIDNLYMEYAQALMSSAGGWPLNVLLTSDLKPFFAVTYLPPKTGKGLMGLQQFIQQIHTLWHSSEREKLIEQAEKVAQIFAKSGIEPVEGQLSLESLKESLDRLLEMADPLYGGWKGTPKFPLGYQSCLFLRYSALKADSRTLFLAELTLSRMFQGGIYDHIGGGFSRYAVDGEWRVPHFEKMLYDNALLSRAYLEGWQLTKNLLYRRVSEEILGYIQRECTLSNGGFASAEDADLDGEEGAYYLWTFEEIQKALPSEIAPLFCDLYDVTPVGNMEGKNLLHMTASFEEFAEERGLPWEDLMLKIEEARRILFQKRKERPRPFQDDKVIAAWNGLMIGSFAKAYGAWGIEKYGKIAQDAARFLRKELWKEGKLFRRWKDGEAKFSACLDDYAYVIYGALCLFEEGLGSEWCKWAIELSLAVEKDFMCPLGGFYFSQAQDSLPARRSELYDGSEPSGNAVHAENLIKLYQITRDEKFLTQAEGIFRSARKQIGIYPLGSCYMLMALLRYFDTKAATVVIALSSQNHGKEEIALLLRSVYKPHMQVIWKEGNEDTGWLADCSCIEDHTTLYLCYADRCLPPIYTLPEILQAIRDL